ncbi:toxin [bacterium]|nr:toxin [bacterium]
MVFNWNIEKNELLKKERGICFEMVQSAIEERRFRLVASHPNKGKYPHQVLFYVLIDEYIYVVPAVPETGGYFLKTIYPSRKQTHAYQKGEWKI